MTITSTWPDDGVSRFLGFRWEGSDTLRLAVRPDLINLGGLLSGAVTYAMVDYCMGSTLWPHTSDDEGIATTSISINYLRTAREGEVVCRCALDRRNRTAASLRGEVRDAEHELLCTAIGTFAIFPRRQ